MKARFVKGHMGGNTISVFRREDFPQSRVLDLVIAGIQDQRLACHEAGLVLQQSASDDFSVDIAGRSSRNWISSCGGFTQVFGKVLSDRDSCEILGIDPPELPAAININTAAGPVLVEIERVDQDISVWTDMSAFLKELYTDDFEEMLLLGFPAWRVGKFLAVNAGVLEKVHNREDIEGLAPPVRNTLMSLQEEFFRHIGRKSLDYLLYDNRPEHGGDFRVVFPHNLPENHIEPACGTGVIAAGMVLFLTGALDGFLSNCGGKCEIVFESGGGPFLGGPEYTVLRLEECCGKMRQARFTHSHVEITAMGKLNLGVGNTGGDEA